MTKSRVVEARTGRGRTRRLAAVLVVALLAPLLVAVAGPTSPAAAASGPQPIPSDLWDAPTPGGVSGSYIWLEGAPGDTVVGDRDLLLPGVFSAGQPPGLDVPYPGLVVGRSSGPSYWTGEFWGTDASTQPGVGYYPDAVSLGDRVDGTPGFGWWDALAGTHHPCATVTGWFAIDHIVRSNDTVTDLDLRFEQACDGGPAIHGKLHLDSTSGPVNPVPAGMWDGVPAGVSGDYFYVEGAAGDPVSRGLDVVAQDPQHPGFPADYERKIVSLIGTGDPEEFWLAEFEGVDDQGLIHAGYYPNLSSATSMSPALAGIRVTRASGGTKSCSPGTTTGWYAVDRIGRIDGQINLLELRFEQSCNGNPPMHGRLHFDAGGREEGSPVGEQGSAAPVTGGVQIDGWALDPETASPIDVDVLVDGLVKTTLSASGDRPDVGQANPLYGNGHGFSTTVSVPTGTHQVCTKARNTGVGADTVLGCKTVTVGAGSPFGSLDVAAAGPASVNVAGWAIDPDTSLPIPVHVYVDSKGVALTADTSRPDVAAAVPGYGPAHGFATQLSAGPGPHTVCAYGINVGVGANVLLGCRSVVVPSGPPVGSLDLAAAGPGVVTAAGWALDWDSGDPISVHVYVDGVGVAVTASGSRPDVGAAFPGWGSGHGFSAQVRMGAGPHTVCAYGIDVGPGANSLIGCRSVVVPGGSPFGSLDVVAGGTGKVTVAGWAIDPDTSASIPVHVYVGPVGTALTADGTRNDVAAAFPGYGPSHGFGSTIDATPGPKQVCAYGINIGVGANSLIGCRTVTVR